MKIHRLPDTLISQIAAGEVVERPASVLKELIENSIDAGASVCDVELEQGGLKLMAVRDNGQGMSFEDAQLSFARHATSKIASYDDLISIGSFGFRGEALAAIASVAHVTMRTREASTQSGTEIVYQGGTAIAEGSVGCAPGTEIVVRNLFFNTPARKKFLKTETTELQHCVLLVTTIALAYPKIAFSLMHNGRELVRLAATDDYLTRIGDVLGKQFVRESAPVDFVTPSISVQGFIGKPGMTLSSKRHQYLFVNGRAVTDASIAHAVSEAYSTRLPARTYPMFVLFIDVDAKEVDVNVHPRKLTVKFAEPGRIFRDTLQAVKQALDTQFISSISMRTDEPVHFSQASRAESLAKNFLSQPAAHAAPSFSSVQKALDFSGDILQATRALEEIENAPRAHASLKNTTPLVQLENSYILVNNQGGLVIVDQHAAHERIMYEKFRARFEHQSNEHLIPIQRFLMPLTLDLTPHERAAYEIATEFLTTLGFEFAVWSGNAVTVEAAPNCFKEKEIVALIKTLFAEINEEGTQKSVAPERLLKSLACKAAVKFGMPLSGLEQSALLEELANTINNATCPHGRPTSIELSFEELERRFYRRK